MMYAWNDGTYLAHHGIKGQKWGVRRWQNEDGSLTPAGYSHYGYGQKKTEKSPDNSNAMSLYKKATDYTKYGDQARAQRDDAKKKLANNKAIKGDLQELKNVKDQLKSSYEQLCGESSQAAKQAYKEYIDRHRDDFNKNKEYYKKYGYNTFEEYAKDADMGYGFFHYEWYEGNPDYDAAYEQYEKTNAGLISKKQSIYKSIGNKIVQNYESMADYDKYDVEYQMDYLTKYLE